MPAQDDLDLSCIRTIQTLSMDGVQAANSGHPGTPMAMAPVAYTLWQKFLRFDPTDPIWPNRDRFVLSVGHASMLLYSMLHLTGVKSVSKDYEDPDEAVGHARRPQEVPPARQQVPRPPRVPLDQRRRDHHRPARPGGRHQRRHGLGRQVARGPLQQARLRPLRLRRLRPLRRRRHDGRRLVRGRQPRRPPQALQPLLDLRLEPDHHRRLDLDHLHRGHRRPVPGLPLERPRGDGRQRHRGARRRRSRTSRTPTTGRPSSSSTATSATARRSRTAPRPTARRSART